MEKLIEIGDSELITRSRTGDAEAFAELFRRHQALARVVAIRNVDSHSDAEDVVSEAFAYTFTKLKEGRGPESSFRAYLLTAVTRIAHRMNLKKSKTIPTSDQQILDQHTDSKDITLDAFESAIIAKAFRELPERWQAVLWYLDIEGQKPAAVAVILGITSNAVSSLAGRAREALRANYLQNHIKPSNPECHENAGRLGAYVAGTLRASIKKQVEDHLATCGSCTALLTEVRDVRSGLRAVMVPLISGLSVPEFQAAVAQLPNPVPTVLPGRIRSLQKAGAICASAALIALFLLLLLPSSHSPQRDSAALPSAQSPLPTPSPRPSPRPSPISRPPSPSAPAATPAPSVPLVIPAPAPTSAKPIPTVPPPVTISARTVSARLPNGGSVTTVTLTSPEKLPSSGVSVVLNLSSGRKFSATQPAQGQGWSCVLLSSASLSCKTARIDQAQPQIVTQIEPGSAATLNVTISGPEVTPASYVNQF
ncbi:RNA polymerase sigma factor (sigma-70 family) [Psychromicrobium silvestre]|uniref:RNA polymerase sigma factor (Sigma-70 family) n=1 Tax=Psychromicrobium silvestre TaxID=1645614 RepID=A0A7Y9S896_9MICC|nr:sigma-70 family RNA polymerase sigma factor [Psychromicrobium silvestre]NYE96649.1 RNA polymerase sigma factor (sigma-70 family) [Psychromicrobium silvestre]